MERLAATKFLETAADLPMLDVRSPAEYISGHIPGARSFPLFSDEERAVIGTIYKQEGREPAIKKGLEITGPNMARFIKEAESFGSEKVTMYCWRGGMRSGSMAWLLEQYGIKVRLLEGGYKAYRRAMADFFERDLPLRVITGYTGSKKTALLHILEDHGEQVIDLEGIAGHQGSSFGNKLCDKEQPTTEHFQNLIFETFRRMDLSRPVWIEDENMRVGRVNMMENLFRRKNQSPHFLLTASREQRLEFLVDEYGKVDKEKLVEATMAIAKKLGKNQAKEAVEYIRQGEMKAAAAIILPYYDARYDNSISRKVHLIRERLEVDLHDLGSVAELLINMKANVLQVN
jgi:tRNA 2-selenouridine synthase